MEWRNLQLTSQNQDVALLNRVYTALELCIQNLKDFDKTSLKFITDKTFI